MIKIYKHYTYEELNRQYNPRTDVPEYENYFKKWEEGSRQAQYNYPVATNICYGSGNPESLAIFPAANPGSKVMIFIHGGFWHLLDKELFYFLSPVFNDKSICSVFINYPSAPAATMDQIVSSCKTALHWLREHIQRYNGDPHEFYIIGHSAGAHLAAMLLATDSASLLKGAILASGIFHLEPVRLSYLNNILQFNPGTVATSSPALLKWLNDCPVLLITGGAESEEFKDQSKGLFEIRSKQNGAIQLLEIPGKNHYSILDCIIDSSSAVHHSIFAMMGGRQKYIH
jgi:arylformamidase